MRIMLPSEANFPTGKGDANGKRQRLGELHISPSARKVPGPHPFIRVHLQGVAVPAVEEPCNRK